MHIVTFDNQSRLIHRHSPNTEIVHCGLIINAGSRDENPKNNGIAHFIEHTVFKGTDKRKSHHILNFIEKVGGELNAYTTREKTCYYVSCLKTYADKAVDILCDIAFAASFPEDEIQKEKKVILEEIEMYDDSPDESIYDHFYTLLFPEHPLGYNILGTKKTVKKLSRKMIHAFCKDYYAPGNVVLSITGDLSNKKAEALAEKYLAQIQEHQFDHQRLKPKSQKPFFITETKDFSQTHCIMGSPAYSKHNPKRFALSLINNILSGSGMSARLSMSVREKHGLTYSISSNYSSYQDTGVFSVYFGTDKNNLEKCISLVNKELLKMCKERLTERQLSQAKIQLVGQVALIDENMSIQMQSQAKSLLDYGKYVSFQDYLENIKKVTADQIIEVCNEILHPDKMSRLIYESE